MFSRMKIIVKNCAKALVAMPALLVFVSGCGKKADCPEEKEYVSPLRNVTINGIDLSEYTLVTPRMYYLPEYTATDYFLKYCGAVVKSAYSSLNPKGNKIILGNVKSDGTECGPFEIEIYSRDGDVYLVCDNTASAQQVLYTFFDKYLSDPTNTNVVIPTDGTPVYSLDQADNWDDANPALLSVQDRIIRGCYKLEEILQYEKTQDIYYTYENHGYEDTIAKARENNNRCTNCVIVGNWVMKDAGFYTKGIYNHMYGDPAPAGYTFSGTSKEFFEQNFTVFDYTSKETSLASLMEEGKILPGDIIGFRSHNQMILPLGYAFDGGRAESNMISREMGGRFRCWVTENPCKTRTVDYVFRANDAIDSGNLR